MNIALYGKGGIGKSTIASNVAAAAADKEKNVLVIGCDPKGDSTATLNNGERITPILQYMKKDEEITEEKVVEKGYNSVRCVEVGGPEPGIGCAGRGIIVALKKLRKVSNVMKESDLILFDVPGDIVCGGLAVPIRKNYVDKAYIVTSGEYLPLYAANNICKGLKKLGAELAGVICNSRTENAEEEKKITSTFAKKLGTNLVSYIPRKDIVQNCERDGKTVIENKPDSSISRKYKEISRDLESDKETTKPSPLTDKEIRAIIKDA
ncbi:MAG: Nitrogenase subunit NifH, ATPase [Candidatus Methanohalarchaeum thermophilum]|uniref:Nitrogenase subunit NifH, ATPase n=1 Tax=Methanohalarchaeum thermophilum TaxID=1903181 RepID=A0A1Q6DVP5_METT1|nr:MAG: Nitrogenase subunit NifH, ATPase [Candidatus Methanohalarchaeum thermophilum]